MVTRTLIWSHFHHSKFTSANVNNTTKNNYMCKNPSSPYLLNTEEINIITCIRDPWRMNCCSNEAILMTVEMVQASCWRLIRTGWNWAATLLDSHWSILMTMSRILDTFTNLTQQHKTINLQNHTDVGPPNNQQTKHFYLMDIMMLNITGKLHKQSFRVWNANFETDSCTTCFDSWACSKQTHNSQGQRQQGKTSRRKTTGGRA